MAEPSAERVAFHEAAHAVLAYRSGFAIRGVEMSPNGTVLAAVAFDVPGWLGAVLDDTPEVVTIDEASCDSAAGLVWVLLAGCTAEQLLTPDCPTPWAVGGSEDRERAEHLCNLFNLDLAQLELETQRMVRERWAEVEAVAGVLAGGAVVDAQAVVDAIQGEMRCHVHPAR